VALSAPSLVMNRLPRSSILPVLPRHLTQHPSRAPVKGRALLVLVTLAAVALMVVAEAGAAAAVVVVVVVAERLAALAWHFHHRPPEYSFTGVSLWLVLRVEVAVLWALRTTADTCRLPPVHQLSSTARNTCLQAMSKTWSRF
jgi:hypothetical protein